jgi:hypothetical protein
LSFWVRSSVTGIYCAAFRNAAFNRTYVVEYNIAAANTWEFKTITIAGDTAGTWATDNSNGLRVAFDLGSGSDSNVTAGAWTASAGTRTTNQVNWANTAGATFYITGVQLEAGDTATPFEHRSFGQELALCQRYYEVQNVDGNGALFTYASAPQLFVSQMFSYAAPKRATPTISATFTSSKFVIAGTLAVDGTGVHTVGGVPATTSGVCVQVNGIATITANAAAAYTYEGSFTIFSSAEL